MHELMILTITLSVVGLVLLAGIIGIAWQFCRGCGLVERRDWTEDDE